MCQGTAKAATFRSLLELLQRKGPSLHNHLYESRACLYLFHTQTVPETNWDTGQCRRHIGTTCVTFHMATCLLSSAPADETLLLYRKSAITLSNARRPGRLVASWMLVISALVTFKLMEEIGACVAIHTHVKPYLAILYGNLGFRMTKAIKPPNVFFSNEGLCHCLLALRLKGQTWRIDLTIWRESSKPFCLHIDFCPVCHWCVFHESQTMLRGSKPHRFWIGMTIQCDGPNAPIILIIFIIHT